MPQRRTQHVAGRPGLRPPRRPTGKFRTAVTWPVRTGFRTIASIIVAAVTALVVGYVVARQDTVFDAVGDALGDEPLLVHPYELNLADSGLPLALPRALTPEEAEKVVRWEDYLELLESANAVPLNMSEVELTIEGNRHEIVIVEHINARVVARTDAPTGTFLSGSPGGGPDEKIILEFDLDSPDKRARTPSYAEPPNEVFDERNYIEIRRGEKLVFTFIGKTRKAYLYEWVIDLVVQVGGRHATVTVGAASPYSVSGPVDEYAAYYAPDVDGRLHTVSAEEVCPNGCTHR